MKGRRLLLASVASVLLAGAAWQFIRPAASKADVPSAAVERRNLSATVMATGTIRPEVGAEVKVGSRVSGLLRKLHFNIGDEVRQGDLIAELDDRDLRARVAQAEADLEAAQARLALLQRGSREQEVAQVQMVVRDAEANLALADKQYQRQAALYREKLISQDALDVPEKNLETARAKLVSAKEQLELVKNKFLPEDLQIAEAQMKQARALLELARTQLSYTKIIAPTGGMIASVSTQEGEAIAAGLQAPTFVTLLNLRRLQAIAFVDEADIGKVRVGQGAALSVGAFPDRQFQGKVAAVLPKAVLQQNVVYYETVITLDNPGGLLRPDMTANITIFVEQRSGVLTVPNPAIKREEGQRVIYVLSNGALQRRVVTTGWKDAGFTEVVRGVREGERVLIGELPSP
jgi:multidrug efflux pump subunit AcrA (membrane-fusion protein)